MDQTLNIYGGSVRVRVMLTPKISAAADYYYYHHVYSDPAALPAGFPANYDRHAVRVGLAVSVSRWQTRPTPRRCRPRGDSETRLCYLAGN